MSKLVTAIRAALASIDTDTLVADMFGQGEYEVDMVLADTTVREFLDGLVEKTEQAHKACQG